MREMDVSDEHECERMKRKTSIEEKMGQLCETGYER
jgi:hypothetical protein